MSFATIDDLRSQLGGSDRLTPEYRAKMLHPFPKAETVKRNDFIVAQCKGKHVLEFGASGKLHDQIVAVSAWVAGVDREDGPGIVGIDLDDVQLIDLPVARRWTGERWYDPDLIVCGEVLEHLSNPGWFLTRLKRQWPGVPVIISVPNAFSCIQSKWIPQGYENVNRDHVAWYSPKTLSVLLERVGYVSGGLFYYNGDGPTAEGLIVVTEAV